MNHVVDPILIAQAARILDLTVMGVRYLANIGRLRSTKTTGGIRLFDRRDVELLARERRAVKEPCVHAE